MQTTVNFAYANVAWVAGSSPAVGARWITPQFRNIRVRFEVFFFSVNPYAIRLFATFLLKIFLYLRLLIFDESAAAFHITVPLEPHMYGLDCRNSTFPRIYPAFDSGGENEVFQNCRMQCNYKKCDVITERCQKLWYNEATKKKGGRKYVCYQYQ